MMPKFLINEAAKEDEDSISGIWNSPCSVVPEKCFSMRKKGKLERTYSQKEQLAFQGVPYLNANDEQSTEVNFGCSEEDAKVRKLILVCVHGNETCGLTAVNELIQVGWFQHQNELLKVKKERVKIILANPRAVLEKKRFVDLNLNRIFQPTYIQNNLSEIFASVPTKYELSRLPILTKAIEWCDYLIDIHSTSAMTPPFVICPSDDKSELFAQTFPVEYMIKDLSKIVQGTTLEWATRLSKIGACVECGFHFDLQSIMVARQVIERFVTDQVVTQAHNIVSCKKSQLIQKGFHFLKKVTAFQDVKFNEVLGEDDNGPISCPFKDGATIIMPTENPIFGEEAWFWGEHKNRIQAQGITSLS